MEGTDLTKFHKGGSEQEKVKELFGKLVSGRAGYTTVLDERNKEAEARRCVKCNWGLEAGSKFCPECGTKN